MPQRPYIWFEVNSAKGVNDYLAHATAWQRIGRLIVSTTATSGDAVYKALGRLPITPGLKTASVLGDPADAAGWREVADACRRFARQCRRRTIVLENETALRDLLTAPAEPDYEAIGKALAGADWGRLEVWWYPSAAVAGDVARQRMVRLAAVAMASIPGCRLVGIIPCPWHKGFAAMLDAQQQVNALDPRNVPIAYLSDGYFADLPSSLAGVSGDVIVYPGLNNLPRAEGVRL